MTPQAIIKARLSEAAAAVGVTFKVTRRKNTWNPDGQYYLTVTGDWKDQRKFMYSYFPGAWITSGGGDVTYGVPLGVVEAILYEVTWDVGWLTRNGGAVQRIARTIRKEQAFDQLPILADALEEAGCENATILAHCRTSEPHGKTCCWVTELACGKH